MKILFWIIFLMLSKLPLLAQPAPQWGNLRPGSYAIGYRTLRLVDPTRRYFDAGRPLQIYVWYPAVRSATASSMRFGDYLEDAAHDWGDDPEQVAYLRESYRKGFKSNALNPSFFPNQNGDSALRAIFAAPIPVVREATPAAGKFPVVLHAHANGALHQSLLLEYLASHGYVVVSLSGYNTCPAFYGRGEGNQAALLSFTEDLALALAQARNLPYADPERAAMVGMLADGGLSLQFKEMSLQALACLDCPWNATAAGIRQLPYYNPRKIRIPLLQLTNTETPQKPALLDSLPFAERYVGTFKAMPHRDFYPFPKIVRPAESGKHTNYDAVLVSVVQFLNAVLKNDARGKAFLRNPAGPNGLPAGFLSIKYQPGQPAIPTENEWLSWLRYGQLDKIREAAKTTPIPQLVTEGNLFFFTVLLIREGEPHAEEAMRLYFSAFPPKQERPYNLFANGFLSTEQPRKALSVCEQWVRQFPQSPHACAGLAEAYQALGETEKAATKARRVLQLLDNAELPAAEKEELRKNAQAKLTP